MVLLYNITVADDKVVQHKIIRHVLTVSTIFIVVLFVLFYDICKGLFTAMRSINDRAFL